MLYSTYLGGDEGDGAYGIALDGSGNAYVTGMTRGDFPTTSGAYQTTFITNNLGFAAKLNAAGGLAYSTYLAGLGWAQAIAVDTSGNAYITGFTSGGLAVTGGAYQSVYKGGSGNNAFVTKLNSAGSALVYSTYLGGSVQDSAYCIAVDGSGNAYLGGYTESPDFPTTSGAIQTVFGTGTADAFVAKLNSAGSALQYSTFLGSGNDGANGIALDLSGNIYVVGSANANFPLTSGAYQTTFYGTIDAFISKINPAGGGTSDLVYSTYLGGSGNVSGKGIAVDSSGNAYVVGSTPGYNFPTTSDAYQPAYGGASSDGDNAFMSEINPAGGGSSDLVYSTYLGGSVGGTNGDSDGFAIALDPSGNVYVAGLADDAGFPTTSGAAQTVFGGNIDAFIAKFSISSTALTPTSTATFSATPTPTVTLTPTTTPTSTSTATITLTPVISFTTTPTPTPTITLTPTPVPLATNQAQPGETFIYPSPVHGQTATVAYYMKESGTVNIRVWNIAAEFVAQLTDNKGPGPQTSPLSMGHYAAGVYLYKIQMQYADGTSEDYPLKQFVVIR